MQYLCLFIILHIYFVGCVVQGFFANCTITIFLRNEKGKKEEERKIEGTNELVIRDKTKSY